jgi:hypothetical protein
VGGLVAGNAQYGVYSLLETEWCVGRRGEFCMALEEEKANDLDRTNEFLHLARHLLHGRLYPLLTRSSVEAFVSVVLLSK